MKLQISFLLIFIINEIHGEEEEKFICAKSGRYENPKDDTCNSFYLCSYSLKGELIQTQYGCPEKTIFSPHTATCSRNYTCPRLSRSTRDLVQIETVNNIHYHCEDKRINNYECLRSGRYADLSGTTCSKYYLCSLLQTGTYVKTLLECPAGSSFDPKTQKCHLDYECPCQQQLPSNDWIGDLSRQEERKEEIVWAELNERWTEHYRWTEIQQRQTESRTSNPLNESCIDPEDAEPFVCKEEGKFPDRKDVTCTDYYFCSKLLNGGFVKTKLSCTYGSTFNPNLRKCSIKYECPCQIATQTSQTIRSTTPRTTEKIPTPTDYMPHVTPLDCEIPTTEFTCTKRGRYPDRRDASCNTYFLCESDQSGKLIKKRYRCPRCLTFDPSTEKCTDNYVCPCSFTEAPSITTKSTQSSLSNSLSTERTKTTTSAVSTKKITTSSEGLTRSTNKTSSTDGNNNTAFSGKTTNTPSKYPSTGRSTSENPNSSKPTTEHSGTSSISQGTSTTNDCIIPPENKPFKCSTKGRFADKRDLTCSSYFLCSALNNGTLIKTKYKCPRKSFFNPSIHKCSELYECPCSNKPSTTSKYSTSNTPKTTGNSSPTTSEETSNPTEDTEITDEITKSSQSSSSTAKSSKKTKTPTSSGSTEKMTTSSSGLTGSTSETSSTGGGNNTSSTGKTKNTPSKSPSTVRTTSENPNGTKTTTQHSGTSSTSHGTSTTNECIIPPKNKPFKCLTKGRFADRRDLTCSSYFLCSALNNGTLIKTKYKCPKKSFFNPSIHRCSELYVCPCSNKPSTTSKYSTSTTPKTTGNSSPTTSEETSNPTEDTEITDEITKSSQSSSSTPKSSKKTKTPTSSGSTEKMTTSSSGLTRSTSKTSSTGGGNNTSSTGKTKNTPSKSPSTVRTTSENPNGSKTTTQHSGTSSTSHGTSTTNECIIPPKNKPFKCLTKGRFADRRDLTCSSYFLCSALNNGTLIKTKYKCPRKSFFNPSIHKCSELYECPCSNKPSTTSKYSTSTTPKTTGFSSPTTSEETSNPTEDTEITDEITKSSQSSSSTPKSSKKTKTPTSSGSTEKMTTSSSGLTGSTSETSSAGGGNNTSSTGKTKNTPSKSPWTSRTTSENPNGSKTTTEHSATTPTIHGTSTTNECIIPPKNKPFKCLTKGRFADKRDLTCSSYFLCSALNNGTLIKTKYKCPRKSFFNPSIHKCSELYECPCSNKPSTTSKYSTSNTPKTTGNSSPTTSEETSNPTEDTEITDEITKSSQSSSSTAKSSKKTKTPTSSGSTEKMTTSSSGLTGSTGKTSSTGGGNNTSSTGKTKNTPSKSPSTVRTTSENPNSSKPTTEHSGTSSTSHGTSTINECIIPPKNKPFKCLTKGRFADRRDLTCSSYFLCSALNNGTLIKTKYKCPRKSFFNPSIHKCSELYECPCSNKPSTTSKYSTSTTPKTTGNSSPTTSEETSNPTEDTEITDEITKSSQSSSSTPKSSKKTKTPTSSGSTEKMTTSSSGLTGSTSETSSTGGGNNTSSTGKTKNTPSKSPSTVRTTSENPNGSKTTTEHSATSPTSHGTSPTNECIIPPKNKPFKCLTKGRFADKRDLTCSSYFLCSALNNGTIIKTKYKCPKQSFFNPSIHRCSELYVCPCSNKPSTTSKYSTSTTPKTTGNSSPTTSEETSYPTEDTEITDEITKSSQSSSSTPKSSKKTKTPTSSGSTEKMTTSSSGLTGSPSETSSTGGGNNTSSTGKTKNTPSKSPSTVRTTSENPNGSKTTTEHSGTSSTSHSTSTTNECIIPPKNKPFKCLTKGRFANRRDLTCFSYFLCSALNNGTLIKTKYNCPKKSFFNPSIHRCSELYECPCSNKPSTTSKYSTSTTPKTTGNSSSTSSEETSNPTEDTEITDEITKSSQGSSSTPKSSKKTKTPASSGSTEKMTTSSSGLTGSTSKTSSTGGGNNTSSTGKTKNTPSKSPWTSRTTSENPNGSKTTTEHSATTPTIHGTSTTNECIIPPKNKPFKCLTKGRFADKRDLTCSSYFLCSALNNGTLIKTKYKCPKKSFFNPSIHRCSELYVCPCTNKPSTTSKYSTSTTPETTGNSSPTTSEETSNPTEDTEITDEITKSSQSSSSTPKSSKKTKTPTSSGSTERMTTPSSGLTGSTSKTSSTGGGNNTSSTGKTKNTPSKSPSTVRTTSENPNGSKTTTEHSGTSSTSHGTSTTNECVIPPKNKPFKCLKKGRFADRRDLTCSSYFLCSALNNGTIIKTKYKCPKKSFFNPSIHRCSELYVCPCSNKPSTTSKYSTSTTPKTTGNSSPAASEETSNPTEDTEVTDEITKSSESSSSTPKSSKKTKTPTSSGSTEKMTTSSGGLTGSTSKTSSTGGGNNTSSTGSTPSKSPSTVRTTSENPNGSKTTTEHSGTSSTSHGTGTTNECVIPPKNKPFKCLTKGRFADRRDLTCSSYFLCSALNNGTLIKTKYKCPKKSFFNPSIHRCSELYECPCSNKPSTTSKYSTSSTRKTTGNSSPTTSEETSYPTEDTEITDEITKSSQRSSSTSKSSKKTKTPTSSGSTEKMTTSSSGLTGSTSKTSSTGGGNNTSSTGETKNTPSKSPWTSRTTSENPNGSKTTTEHSATTPTIHGTSTTNECIIPPKNKPFKCLTKGRFADKRDLTCSSYFLCSALNNGTLIKTKYKCPKKSFFNPSIHRCSELYVCPCTNKPSTTSKYSTSTTPETTGNSSPTTSEETSNPTEDTEITDEITKSSQSSSSTPKSSKKTKTPTSSGSTESMTTPSSGLTGSTSKTSSTGGGNNTSSTGKTKNTPSKSPSTVRTTSENPNGSKTTTEHSGTSSTSHGTSTTNECVIPPKNKPFKCLKKGRFADRRDLTCSSYFLCSALNNGTIIKTKYKCPKKSFFNPSIHRCSELYVCPCSNKPSTTSKYSTSTTPKTTGNSSPAASEETSNPTEDTEVTDEITKSSESSSSTPKSSKKTKTPTSSGSTEKMTTSSGGLTGSTSKTSSTGGGNNTSSTGSTPSKSPSTVRTTSENPNGSKTTTEHSGTSSTSHGTGTTNECVIPPKNKPFKCLTKGRFADRRDLTCSSYFLCSALNNGTLIKTKYKCPKKSFFNPSIHRCSELYECPCSNKPSTTSKYSTSSTRKTTGNSSPTTSEETSYPTEDTEITDEITKSSQRSSSTSKSSKKTKTPTSSGSTEKMTTSSSGLTGSTSKTSSTGGGNNTSSTGKTKNTPSKSPWTSRTTSENPNGSKTTTEHSATTPTIHGTSTTNECIIPPKNKPFKCLTKGRFADKRDLTCSSYFLCSALNNGTLIKTKYKCPKKSFFNPSIHRCSELYVCPCTNKPSTTSKYSTSTTPETTGNSSPTTSEETSNPTEDTEITDEITKSSQSSSSTPKSSKKTKTPTSSGSTERMTTPSSGLTGSTSKTSSTGGGNNTSSTGKTKNTPSKSPSTVRTTSENPNGSKTTTEHSATTPTIHGTSTTNECIIPPKNKPFKCLKKGRFADRRDLTCSSYFLCSALNNGTLIKTKYKCPKKSFFNPSIHRCSELYVCPCTNKPSTTSKYSTSSTPKTTGNSVPTTSEETSNPTEDTEITDEITKSSQSSSSTPKSSKKTKTPTSSGSTEKMTTSSSGMTGSTSKTSSTRGGNITSSTGKTTNTSSKSPSTDRSTSENPNSSKTTIGNSGTASTSTTSNDCIIPPSGKPFKCLTEGRFPNKRDLSCSSYFLCSALNNGTLVKTEHRCSINSFFNPSLHQCSELYKCPCSNSPTTTSKYSSSTSRNTGKSSFSTSEKPSKPTSNTEKTNENTKSSQSVSSSPRSTETSHTSSSTFSSSKDYTINSESTDSICIVPPPSYKFVCETQGRFADLLDKSCTSYFLCSLLGDGTFVQARYRCSGGLKFNPIKQNCSPFYSCPCDITTTTPTTSQASSISTVVPDICQSTAEEFVCTSVGRFPKPGDVSCCTYYSCSRSVNGTISQTEFSCPEGSSFDPVFRICSDTYQCPCHVTESPEYFSTSSDNCIVPTEEFMCTASGRFPNRQDVSCCNYFLCNDLGNGTFTKTEYNCPMGKSFDPELKRCSSSYICPCRITENPLTSTIETSSTTTVSSTYVTISKAPITAITQPPECDISINNTEHVCTQRGRFRDNKDLTCSNYFLCSKLKNGQFIRTRYSCPRFSYFDPSVGLCTTTFKCPCISTGSTVSRSTGKITKIPGTRAPWRNITKKTTLATTPTACVPSNPSLSEFVCSAPGKFLNPLDIKCTSYIHCIQKAKGLVKTVVNCEGMTVFDVYSQKCTANAVCEVCKE